MSGWWSLQLVCKFLYPSYPYWLLPIFVVPKTSLTDTSIWTLLGILCFCVLILLKKGIVFTRKNKLRIMGNNVKLPFLSLLQGNVVTLLLLLRFYQGFVLVQYADLHQCHTQQKEQSTKERPWPTEHLLETGLYVF